MLHFVYFLKPCLTRHNKGSGSHKGDLGVSRCNGGFPNPELGFGKTSFKRVMWEAFVYNEMKKSSITDPSNLSFTEIAVNFHQMP